MVKNGEVDARELGDGDRASVRDEVLARAERRSGRSIESRMDESLGAGLVHQARGSMIALAMTRWQRGRQRRDRIAAGDRPWWAAPMGPSPRRHAPAVARPELTPRRQTGGSKSAATPAGIGRQHRGDTDWQALVTVVVTDLQSQEVKSAFGALDSQHNGLSVRVDAPEELIVVVGSTREVQLHKQSVSPRTTRCGSLTGSSTR